MAWRPRPHPLLAACAASLACGPAPETAVQAADTAAEDLAWPDGVTATPVARCEDPLPAPAWDEVGGALGLPGHPDPDAPHENGVGVVVHDLDGDGVLDLFFGWMGAPPVVGWGDGSGTYALETVADASLSLGQPSLHDADGDGDLDLLFGAQAERIQALRVDGRALTPWDLGPTRTDHGYLRELEPGDLDGDGIDELFASYNGDPERPDAIADRMAGVTADGLTLDAPLPAEVSGQLAFDAVWFDHRGDGDWDVYVVNDQGGRFGGNVLWDNRGGALFEDAWRTGTASPMDAMGADAADLNGDGLEDLLSMGTSRGVILVAQDDGTYVDVTAAWGLSLPFGGDSMAWGVQALDIDNDADRDLFVALGDKYGPSLPEGFEQTLPLEVYTRDGDTYAAVGAELGLARTGSWRAVVGAHLNDDGVLDLVASDVVGRPHVYRSTGCTADGWLSVTAPNGSRVRVEDASGRVQTDVTRSGSSYGAATTPMSHFGLGAAQAVERLDVVLPGGAEVVVEGPFVARRGLTVTR